MRCGQVEASREALLAWLGLGATGLDQILDGEDAGDAVGEDVGAVGVGFGIDDADEDDVAAFDDDVDGEGAEGFLGAGGHVPALEGAAEECATGAAGVEATAGGVAAEGGVAIDGAEDGPADLIVVGGQGQDFDLVFDLFNALDGFEDAFGVFFEGGAHGVAAEGEFGAFEFEGEEVEAAVVGESDELAADLFDEVSFGLLREQGGCRGSEEEMSACHGTSIVDRW